MTAETEGKKYICNAAAADTAGVSMRVVAQKPLFFSYVTRKEKTVPVEMAREIRQSAICRGVKTISRTCTFN